MHEDKKNVGEAGTIRLSPEEAVEQFSDCVYRLAFARCRQVADAEDVFQEVFLSFMKAKPEFNSLEHAKAWFLRVTCNACNSFWRKQQTRAESSFDEAIEVIDPIDSGSYDRVEAGSEQVIKRVDLEHCLEALKEQDRELIHLFYFEDLRTLDISQIWEKKEGAVRMQLSRARKALKQCLEMRV